MSSNDVFYGKVILCCFFDKLESIRHSLELEFNKLFEDVLQCQPHPNELILIDINAHYDETLLEQNDIPIQSSPYKFGLSDIGLAEETHNNFIMAYKDNMCYPSYEQYCQALNNCGENFDELEKLRSNESFTIQLEMLIYLKIWESDAFIKSWVQIVRLLRREDYDWHYTIKNKKPSFRQEQIRIEIRDKLKAYPTIYRAFNVAYVTQLRNAIAHSQYAFLDRTIQFNNYREGDEVTPLNFMSFDDWVERFHTTMIIHNEYLRFRKKIHEYYALKAQKHNGKLDFRVVKQIQKVIELRPLIYDIDWDRWV